MAITPELLEYIKQSLSAGVSEQDIKTALVSQGWIEADITEAFSQTNGSVSPVVESPVAVNILQTNNLPEIPQKSSRKRNMIITGVAVVVVLLLVGTATAFFLIPVKPEAVINQAFSKMTIIDALTIQAKVTGDVTTPDLISSILTQQGVAKNPADGIVAGSQKSKLELQFKGSIDASVPLQTKAKGSFGLEIQNYKLIVDYLSTNEGDFFAKLTEAPILPYVNLDLIKNIWVELFTKQDLQKIYDKNEIKQEELSEEQLEQIMQAFEDNKPYVITEKLDGEEINSQSTYHYKYHIDMDKLERLGNEINNIISDKKLFETNEDLKKEAKIADGEIWIGKKDKYLYKITGGFTVDPEVSKQASGVVNWEILFSDFNKKFDVSAPSNFKTLEEAKDLLIGPIMEQYNSGNSYVPSGSYYGNNSGY
jgi:hypothetical protein